MSKKSNVQPKATITICCKATLKNQSLKKMGKKMGKNVMCSKATITIRCKATLNDYNKKMGKKNKMGKKYNVQQSYNYNALQGNVKNLVL